MYLTFWPPFWRRVYSVTGIVRHIGKADNFRRLLKLIDNFLALFGQVWTLFWQSWRCSFKVVVVRTKLTLFVQSCRGPCKVRRCSYKVWTLFVQSCHRSLYKVDVVLQSVVVVLHKVDVVCTKCCTKKEESWQVNFDIKTASYSPAFPSLLPQ